MKNNQPLPDWTRKDRDIKEVKWVGEKVLVLSEDREDGFLSLGLYDETGQRSVDDYAGRDGADLNKLKDRAFFEAIFNRINTVAEFFEEQGKVRELIASVLKNSNSKSS